MGKQECAREKKPSPCRVNDSGLVWSKTVEQKGHSLGGVCVSAYVQMKAIGWFVGGGIRYNRLFS